LQVAVTEQSDELRRMRDVLQELRFDDEERREEWEPVQSSTEMTATSDDEGLAAAATVRPAASGAVASYDSDDEELQAEVLRLSLVEAAIDREVEEVADTAELLPPEAAGLPRQHSEREVPRQMTGEEGWEVELN
jgi:hypothetical protein